MSIDPPERETQRRIIALFREELGYRYLGDRSYEDNSNIMEAHLTANLRTRGYGRAQISRAIYLLRTQADFDNYRKRMLREREESARYANAALLSDLLAVIDDFERAIRSAEESRDFGVFLEGVSMIERRMLEMLESRWGLKRFSSVGEAFDPVRHEAMMRTEAPAAAGADPSGPVVVEEFQKGYYLHERVLRPAKVRVQVPAEAPVPPAGTPGAGQG